MNLINENIVLLNCEASTKEEAINLMANAMKEQGNIADVNQYVNDVIERENTGSTAVGFNYATPHAKSSGVSAPCLGYMTFLNPVKWDEDNDSVKNAFQIAVPEGGGDEHLQILAKIFRALIHEDFRQSLANANSKSEIVQIVNSL